jgi:hypothetical protein
LFILYWYFFFEKKTTKTTSVDTISGLSRDVVLMLELTTWKRRLQRGNRKSTVMVCGGFTCSKNALAALNVLYFVSYWLAVLLSTFTVGLNIRTYGTEIEKLLIVISYVYVVIAVGKRVSHAGLVKYSIEFKLLLKLNYLFYRSDESTTFSWLLIRIKRHRQQWLGKNFWQWAHCSLLFMTMNNFQYQWVDIQLQGIFRDLFGQRDGFF